MFRQAKGKGHTAPSFALSRATYKPLHSNTRKMVHGPIAMKELRRSTNLTSITRPVIMPSLVAD
jgi:hypothetical protein